MRHSGLRSGGRLLSRIKEEHDKGPGTVESVAKGLERTGRIVTAVVLLATDQVEPGLEAFPLAVELWAVVHGCTSLPSPAWAGRLAGGHR